MSVDKDVATVLALEEPAKALLEAIRTAQPAIKRLRKADYPGADWVSDNIEDDPRAALGTPCKFANAVKMFRESAGDLAVFDYLFFVEDMGLSLKGAAEQLLDWSGDDDEKLRRIEGLRLYAATAAR